MTKPPADDPVERLRQRLVSAIFGLTQPDHGDVFSWFDDHAHEIAEAVSNEAAAELTRLRAMCDELAEPRSLETAPKDGSYFLMLGSNFDGGMAVVQWDEGLEWWTLDDGKNPEIMLRHEAMLTGWLPLPSRTAYAKYQQEQGR